jgi:hypothetical protein
MATLTKIYRGITRNLLHNDSPAPNRPGNIEEVTLDAIQDAIAQDSLNPDDITLPQSKTLIRSPVGNAMMQPFNVLASADTLVDLFTIPAVNPLATYTGFAGFLQIMAHEADAAFAAVCPMIAFRFNVLCGVGQFAFKIHELPNTEIDLWEVSDAGVGSNKLCIVVNYGASGAPATIQIINRYSFYTGLSVLGYGLITPIDIVL